MPPIRQGPLRGMYAPEYEGGSIVNLLASLIRARGGRSPHRGLLGFPDRAARAARCVVYLVLDGLGEEQLRHYLRTARRSPFWGAHPRQVITTVFPATTAAAVTTFATGAAPAEHGILGWHLHLGDLGLVSTILLATTRTGAPMAEDDFNLKDYLRLPSYLESVPGPRTLISFGTIPESRYSKAGLKWHRKAACRTLAGLVRHMTAFGRRGRGLAYAYWPMLDTLCHAHGVDHPKVRRHLATLDHALARVWKLLQGTGTLLVVTSDHGLVEASHSQCIELRDLPGFYDCLAVLPSGDAREVSCFVRPGRERTFLERVRKHLGRACRCVKGQWLMKHGFFGGGRRHPALSQRVGDYVLIARGGYAFSATPAGATSDFHRANHGGMSAEEMRVPLYVLSG